MFKIYHIIGRKIGITSRDVKKRIREQFRVKVHGHVNYEILEVHDDASIAAKREIQLQKEYGYRVDRIEYDLNRLSTNGVMMGKINGSKNKGKNMGRTKQYKIKKGYDKSDKKYYGTPAKPIIVYDKLGNLVGEFKSTKFAGKILGCGCSYISNVLHGRIKNTKKYDFKYAQAN